MSTATMELNKTEEKRVDGVAGGQVVVLRVRGSDYALPIGSVQEIVRVPEITPLPEAPNGVEGLINLRGRVLPVIDLPSRLGLGESARTRASRVVVVRSGGEQRFDVGLLVDGVSKVLRIAADEVEPPSDLAGPNSQSLVLGIAKLGEQLVLLLDLYYTLASYQHLN